MADPARMKAEDAPERATSPNDEQPNVKSAKDEELPETEKSTEENKDSSSQDQPKQEVKSVSSGLLSR